MRDERYVVIDEAGDVCSAFDDVKDAELYIAENCGHALTIVDTVIELPQ